MTDKQNFEKDINVPSKRLDYTDKIHIELANYEQMERDIEKIIEPYQTEIEAEAFSLPVAIESILERKEQENKVLEDTNNALRLRFSEDTTRLSAELQLKEQECEKLKEEIENHCFDCDVAERMRKVTYAATGGRLSYANYTVEAIEQAYHDQLRIDVEYETKELNEELDKLKEENKKLKWYLNEIRADELKSLDIDFDEYETERTCTEFTNIITLVERALGEIE